jgi:hypothetical protein
MSEYRDYPSFAEWLKNSPNAHEFLKRPEFAIEPPPLGEADSDGGECD